MDFYHFFEVGTLFLYLFGGSGGRGLFSLVLGVPNRKGAIKGGIAVSAPFLDPLFMG